MFKNAKEFALAMLEGREFKAKTNWPYAGEFIYYFSDGLMTGFMIRKADDESRKAYFEGTDWNVYDRVKELPIDKKTS